MRHEQSMKFLFALEPSRRRAMTWKLLVQVFMLLAAGGEAQGQAGYSNDTARSYVAATASMIHSCILADELLRKLCARAGPLPQPEKNGKLCALPALSFESRTAADYAAYKAFHRTTFTDDEAEIAKAVNDARATFERYYGRLRSGPFTMLDLDGLNREAADCARVVPRLLSTALRKK
jgi:hypothetical protein